MRDAQTLGHLRVFERDRRVSKTYLGYLRSVFRAFINQSEQTAVGRHRPLTRRPRKGMNSGDLSVVKLDATGAANRSMHAGLVEELTP